MVRSGRNRRANACPTAPVLPDGTQEVNGLFAKKLSAFPRPAGRPFVPANSRGANPSRIGRCRFVIVWFVANELPLWIPEASVAVAIIVAIPAIGNFLHTLNKDRGDEARRLKVLEAARNRMEYWRTRIDIQSKILDEKQLHDAKQETIRAIEKIALEANHNLLVLSERRAGRSRMPTWRTFLLLYRPAVSKRKWESYLQRICYLFSLFGVLISACGLAFGPISYLQNELLRIPHKYDFVYPQNHLRVYLIGFFLSTFNAVAYFIWVRRREGWSRDQTKQKTILLEEL